MSAPNGVSVVTCDTDHPHLVVGSAVYQDETWQIPVRDEGRWTVLLRHPDGSFWRQMLNGEVYNWPRAIAIRICADLAAAGAFLDDNRAGDHHDDHDALCLSHVYNAYAPEWRGRGDGDYEAAGGQR